MRKLVVLVLLSAVVAVAFAVADDDFLELDDGMFDSPAEKKELLQKVEESAATKHFKASINWHRQHCSQALPKFTSFSAESAEKKTFQIKKHDYHGYKVSVKAELGSTTVEFSGNVFFNHTSHHWQSFHIAPAVCPPATAAPTTAAPTTAAPKEEDDEDMDLEGVLDDEADVETSDNLDALTNADIVGSALPASTEDPVVVGAAQHLLGQINFARKKCKKNVYDVKSLVVTKAKSLAATKSRVITLEIQVGGRTFQATIAHLAPFLGRYHASSGEDKQFNTKKVSPAPCSDKSLAMTFAEIDAHNANPERTYDAAMYPQMIGNTENAFATGAIVPPMDQEDPRRIKTITMEDVQMGDEPPATFDFQAANPTCRATNEILDQGSCGSCYAQAAATSFGASLFKASNAKFNVKLSPQEMADCTNQCSGGFATNVYAQMKNKGFPEESCDPDKHQAGKCDQYCADALLWKPTNYGRLNLYGLPTDQAEKAIRQAVVQYGPLWVAFWVYSSFHAYRGGVYTVGDGGAKAGGHAVTLVGWGEDSTGKYWICQNSWSKYWGEKGRFRIRRGTNEAEIESWGVIYVEPLPRPANLPENCDLVCQNGGALQMDCSCKCRGLFNGKTCETCPNDKTCQNGGVFDPKTCSCKCAAGTYGNDCSQYVAKLNTNTVCKDGSGARLTLSWNKAVPTGSTCTIISGWTNKAVGYYCGGESAWSKTNTLCPESGSMTFDAATIKKLSTGSYKIRCSEFLGINEFGQSRGYSWMDEEADLAKFTIKASGCKAAAEADIEEESDDEDVEDLFDDYSNMDDSADLEVTPNKSFPKVVGGSYPVDVNNPLVLEAMQHVIGEINYARKQRCKKTEYSNPRAVKVISSSGGKYRLFDIEMKLSFKDGAKLSDRTFFVRLRHIPSFKKEFHASSGAPKRWSTTKLSPDPCLNKDLATSFAQVDAHNADPERTYDASVYPWDLGQTEFYYQGGAIVPDVSSVDPSLIKDLTEEDVEMGDEPPATYDFQSENPTCRATKEILDQGSCGSCYAQAAAASFGASLYKVSSAKVNIKLSPQEMADCTNQCSGGFATGVYDKMKTKGFPEESCDPDKHEAGTCGQYCTGASLWKPVNYGWIRTSGLADYNAAEKAIRQAVIQYGPVWVAFDVYDSFHNYRGGIYTVTAGSQKGGGHAVIIVGWGEEGGQKYWIVQNSWSKNWGEKGRFRIRRGSNEANIESWAIIYVVPQTRPANLPSSCTKECQNGGSVTVDCSCKCAGLFSGDLCETCPSISCQNGGAFDQTNCKCNCPSGTYGNDCSQYVAKPSTSVVCKDGSGSALTLSWNKPSPVGSFCNLIQNGDNKASIFLCGDSSKWTKTNTLCPATGSANVESYYVRSLPVGNYQVKCAENLGINEFGQSRGYGWMDSENVMGTFEVRSSGCRKYAEEDLEESVASDEDNVAPSDELDEALFDALYGEEN